MVEGLGPFSISTGLFDWTADAILILGQNFLNCGLRNEFAPPKSLNQSAARRGEPASIWSTMVARNNNNSPPFSMN